MQLILFEAEPAAPPSVIVWENVPGVLSSRDNAFGCFLGALAGEDQELEPEPRPAAGRSSRYWRWDKKSGEHTPSWPNAGAVIGPSRAIAWRVLDAQYFGLAQRRRRVFVVASARKGFDPAAVLFEFDGVRRDTAPSREAQQDIPGTIAGGARGRGGYSHDDIPLTAVTLRSTDGGSDVDHARAGHLQPVVGTLLANGKAAGSATQQDAESGLLIPVQCVTGDITHTLKAEGFDASSPPPALVTATAVRRLTPRECERLQGFPDNYTLISWRTYQEAQRKGTSYESLLAERGMRLREPASEDCPDGPRYKALGNSKAVPVVRWIGERIQQQLDA